MSTPLFWFRYGDMAPMSPPLSPPFENFTFRSRYDMICDNDSDASYNTDEEKERFQFELLKDEFPECYKPIPRGIPELCYCCQDPVVIRIENGKRLLECQTKKAGFVRHYRRWWDDAAKEELLFRNEEIRKLREKVADLEKIVQQRNK